MLYEFIFAKSTALFGKHKIWCKFVIYNIIKSFHPFSLKTLFLASSEVNACSTIINLHYLKNRLQFGWGLCRGFPKGGFHKLRWQARGRRCHPNIFTTHIQSTDSFKILHTLLVKHYNDLLKRQSSERGKDEVTYFYVGSCFLYSPWD